MLVSTNSCTKNPQQIEVMELDLCFVCIFFVPVVSVDCNEPRRLIGLHFMHELLAGNSSKDSNNFECHIYCVSSYDIFGGSLYNSKVLSSITSLRKTEVCHGVTIMTSPGPGARQSNQFKINTLCVPRTVLISTFVTKIPLKVY